MTLAPPRTQPPRSASRSRSRPALARRWSQLRPLAVAVSSGIALVLGILGYQAAVPDLEFTAAVLRSLQLFVLEGGIVSGDTPWQLEVARFLAPAALGYAAIRGVLLVARDNVVTWRTRLTARGHTVVIGTTPTAQAIATDLLAKKRRVVVLASSGDTALEGLRARGATVIEGDATDPLILAGVRPERATDVILSPGADTEAIRVLAACETAIARAPRSPAVHVEITTPALWSEVHCVALASPDARPRVEFFLAADREARIMLQGTPATLVLDGEGAVIDRLVAHAVRTATIDGRSISIALTGAASGSADRLIEEMPWLAEGGGPCLGIPDRPVEPVLGVVAGLDDASAIGAGAELARALPSAVVRVAVSDGAVRDALDQTRLRCVSVELVAARSSALGSALLNESATELLARAKHNDYFARETVRQVAVQDNPSMVSWEQLPESLRESNRRFAASVGGKLASIGASLAPIGASVPVEDLVLDPSLLEHLAKTEHDRWVADLTTDGWRPTTEAKDPQKKLHPLLVSWDELSEAEREKDRDGLRALPRLLARAGYRLDLPREGAR